MRLSSLFSWFGRFRQMVSSGKLAGHEFGAIKMGSHRLDMVPFKHPHIGKVKLFYVDARVRDSLSEVEV